VRSSTSHVGGHGLTEVMCVCGVQLNCMMAVLCECRLAMMAAGAAASVGVVNCCALEVLFMVYVVCVCHSSLQTFCCFAQHCALRCRLFWTKVFDRGLPVKQSHSCSDHKLDMGEGEDCVLLTAAVAVAVLCSSIEWPQRCHGARWKWHMSAVCPIVCGWVAEFTSKSTFVCQVNTVC